MDNMIKNQLCSQIILAIMISWLFSFILTITDVFPTDPEAYGYGARTGVDSGSLAEVPWLYLPYPGIGCEIRWRQLHFEERKGVEFSLAMASKHNSNYRSYYDEMHVQLLIVQLTNNHYYCSSWSSVSA